MSKVSTNYFEYNYYIIFVVVICAAVASVIVT